MSTPRFEWPDKRLAKASVFGAANFDTASTTGSGSQDDNSSVSSGMEDLEAENARLLKDLDVMRSESFLLTDNEALRRQNMFLKKQCDAFRQATMNFQISEADDFATEKKQSPMKDACSRRQSEAAKPAPPSFPPGTMWIAMPMMNSMPEARRTNQPLAYAASTRACMAMPSVGMQARAEPPAANACNTGGRSFVPKSSAGSSVGQKSMRKSKNEEDHLNSIRSREGFQAKPVSDCDATVDTRTTVMLRSFPNNYSSTMLLDLFNTEGFKGKYDFMYLPMDFMTAANLGYCFLNFTTHNNAQSFIEAFDGFSRWVVPSKKCCTVVWSDPHQGLEDYIERYRNSPIMHRSVPLEYKPALFRDGERVPFPAPTKNVRAPRIRYLTNS
jgi:hypothetical protein